MLPTMVEETDIEPPLVARAAGGDALEALSHTSMRCGGCGAKVTLRLARAVGGRRGGEGHGWCG